MTTPGGALHFAYDGTVHGDWLAHYAIQLASRTPSRRLHLVHVDEGRIPREALAERILRLDGWCLARRVSLRSAIRDLRGSLLETLEEMIPRGEGSPLLCGTRALPGAGGGMIGTVARGLLRDPGRRTLAIRVVHPGRLGVPCDILLPVAGPRDGLGETLPSLQLFRPDIHRVHVLRVLPPASRSSRIPLGESETTSDAQAYCSRIARDLEHELGLKSHAVDAISVSARDAVQEILVHANRLRVHLILMGLEGAGDPRDVERILASAPCDVAVHGSGR